MYMSRSGVTTTPFEYVECVSCNAVAGNVSWQCGYSGSCFGASCGSSACRLECVAERLGRQAVQHGGNLDGLVDRRLCRRPHRWLSEHRVVAFPIGKHVRTHELCNVADHRLPICGVQPGLPNRERDRTVARCAQRTTIRQ